MSVAYAEVLGRDPLELWLLGGLAVVMLAAFARSAWVKRSIRAQSGEIDPFLVFPENSVHRPMTPSPLYGLAWAPPSTDEEADEEAARGIEEIEERPPAPAPPLPPAPRLTPADAGRARAWIPREAPVAPAAAFGFPHGSAAHSSSWSVTPAPKPDAVDEASETIRLPTAGDGTVQLLPGLLVMTRGPEVGREYRFLRVGNQLVPEITMGRASGPPYRHIHLPAATVSRMHGRIRYQDGSWRIANLSATNPLRLNGHEVGAMEELVMADGDRIELGEVELSYQDQRK